MGFIKDVAKDVAGSVVTGAINKILGNIGEKGSDQGFNVQKMVSSINKTGVAKSAHFEVQIIAPSELKTKVDVLEHLMYRADATDIPARSFQTIDHRFTNYGPLSKVPYMPTYSDVSVSFLLSEDMREKEFFETWHNSIVNTGSFESGGSDTLNGRYGNAQFNNKYHSDYIGTVVIRQFGSQGELRSIHTLKEAYPILMNSIPMSWGEDGLAKMSVSFTYRYYNAVFYKQDQPGMGFGFGVNIGKGGIKGSMRLPGLGTITRGSTGTSINTDPLKKRIVSAIL